MRKNIFLVFLLLLLSSAAKAQGFVPASFSGAATFGTPVTASKFSCSTGTTCAITVTSTGSGDAGTIAMVTTTAPPNGIVSATGCQTSWAVVRGAASAAYGTSAYQDWAYCPKLTGGVTSITVTFWTSITTPSLVFWDTPLTGQVFFDTGNGLYDSANCTSCTGTALTLNLGNDVIFTFAVPDNSLSAVSSPYTADQSFPGGTGMAHLLNTVSGTAPTWTQSPTGPMVSSAIALGTQLTGPAVVKAYGYTTHTSGTTVSISYTPEMAGDVLVAFYGAVVTSGSCSISDGTNTYVVPTLGTGSNPTVSSAATIYSAYVASLSASSVTITVTCPTDTNRAIMVAELHGVTTLDQSGMEVETSTTGGAWSGPNFTTTSYPELGIGGVACDEYCINGSGWSQLTGDSDGSIFEYQRWLLSTVTKAVTGTDSAGSGVSEIVWWQTWH